MFSCFDLCVLECNFLFVLLFLFVIFCLPEMRLSGPLYNNCLVKFVTILDLCMCSVLDARISFGIRALIILVWVIYKF